MAFYINGTQVHEPRQGGITITDEPIWGSNAGRDQNGNMGGDFLGFKTTIAVTFPPMSFNAAKTIKNAIMAGMNSSTNEKGFFKIKYPDFPLDSNGHYSASTLEEKTVYAGNIPRTLYSLAQGRRLDTDITITFVEK